MRPLAKRPRVKAPLADQMIALRMKTSSRVAIEEFCDRYQISISSLVRHSISSMLHCASQDDIAIMAGVDPRLIADPVSGTSQA